jgi:ABC-2 type transport system permease protein
LITGLVLGLTGFDSVLAMNAFLKISTVYLMYIVVATPSAFMANMSKGYLASIGFIFAIIIAINALGNTIFVHYFPWSIPALFLKTGTLSLSGIIIMLCTGIAGVIGTFAWWRYAEQN